MQYFSSLSNLPPRPKQILRMRTTTTASPTAADADSQVSGAVEKYGEIFLLFCMWSSGGFNPEQVDLIAAPSQKGTS